MMGREAEQASMLFGKSLPVGEKKMRKGPTQRKGRGCRKGEIT